jgi:hypothetical protein
LEDNSYGKDINATSGARQTLVLSEQHWLSDKQLKGIQGIGSQRQILL